MTTFGTPNETTTGPTVAPVETKATPAVAPTPKTPEEMEAKAKADAEKERTLSEDAKTADANLEKSLREGDVSGVKKDAEAAKNVPKKKENFMDKINAKLEAASPETLRQLAEIMKMFGWNFAADYLNARIETKEIREKMADMLGGPDNILKNPKDGQTAAKIKAQWRALLGSSEGKKTEENFTFDTFLTQRLTVLKNGKKPPYSMEDLRTARSKTEADIEAETNDKRIVKLEEAGFKKEADNTWKINEINLGGETKDGNHPVNATLSFFRDTTDNTWTWKINDAEPALTMFRFLTLDDKLPQDKKLSDEQKNNRAKINKLADFVVGIPPTTPAVAVKPAAPAPTVAPTGTPPSTPASTPTATPTATPTVTPPATPTPAATETPTAKP